MNPILDNETNNEKKSATNPLLADIRKSEKKIISYKKKHWDRKSIREDTLKMILDRLAKGEIPWEQIGKSRQLPTNNDTKKPYTGITALRLAMKKAETAPEFPDSLWMTFEQMNGINYKMDQDYKKMQEDNPTLEFDKPERKKLKKDTHGIAVESVRSYTKDANGKLLRLDKPEIQFPLLFHIKDFVNVSPNMDCVKVMPPDVMKHIPVEDLKPLKFDKPVAELQKYEVINSLQLELLSNYIAARTGHPELAFVVPEMAQRYNEVIKDMGLKFETTLSSVEDVAHNIVKKAIDLDKQETQSQAVDTNKEQKQETVVFR